MIFKSWDNGATLFGLDTEEQVKQIAKIILNWNLILDKTQNNTQMFFQDAAIVKVIPEQIPCLFCGKSYKGERGLNLHLKKCSEKE